MKKGLIQFFVILALVTSFQVLVRAQNQTQAQVQKKNRTKTPELPDYTKEPWQFFEKISDFSTYNHPEWTMNLHGNLYETDEYPKVKDLILVILNDDDNPVYAEWLKQNKNDGSIVVRGYEYKNGKWVYEKEVRRKLNPAIRLR